MLAQEVNPSRPLYSDNPDLSKPGYLELEIGVTKMEDHFSIPAMLKLSPLQNFEVGLFVTGISEGHDSDPEFGKFGTRLKYQMFDINYFSLAMAGRFTFYDIVNVENFFYINPAFNSEIIQIRSTIGITTYNFEYSDFAHFSYSIAAISKLKIPISPFVEFYRINYTKYKSPMSISVGSYLTASPDFSIDASYTFGLNEDKDWVFQVGFTKTLLKLF